MGLTSDACELVGMFIILYVILIGYISYTQYEGLHTNYTSQLNMLLARRYKSAIVKNIKWRAKKNVR